MAVQYGFGQITTDGITLIVDAADPTSYPGSGTSWINVINRNITGSLTGSVTYTSNFKGGLTFNNTSSAILFSSNIGNYGTSSFTVEMTFTPTTINGTHWLFSKNSGSFPNYGVYLSGSNNTGKLVTEYRITSTTSCSYVSNITLTTGSNYQVDVNYLPFFTASLSSGIFGATTYINSQVDNSLFTTNISGSLSNTASFTVGNNNTISSGFLGTVYSLRVYNKNTFAYAGLLPAQVFSNYRIQNYRMSMPVPFNRYLEMLIVGGGGNCPSTGSFSLTVGAGGGGLLYLPAVYFSSFSGSFPVVVGGGGSNSYISTRLDLLTYGGGTLASNGGSGAGGITGGGGLAGSFPAGRGIPGQGNPGGEGISNPGGGGGAGTSGSNGTSSRAGNGGNGLYFPQFATLTVGSGSPAGWYAGGGAGGTQIGSSGVGGLGGGGNGSYSGNNGVINTGGGAGGYATFSGESFKSGGSGLVIIRYPGAPIATGGVVITTGSYTSHVFTSSGNFTFL